MTETLTFAIEEFLSPRSPWVPADEGDVVAVHLENARAALPQGALVVHHEHADARLDFAGNGERIARGVRRLAAGVRLRERVGHPALLVRGTDVRRRPAKETASVYPDGPGGSP